jgi:hypothetical protein
MKFTGFLIVTVAIVYACMALEGKAIVDTFLQVVGV